MQNILAASVSPTHFSDFPRDVYPSHSFGDYFAEYLAASDNSTAIYVPDTSPEPLSSAHEASVLAQPEGLIAKGSGSEPESLPPPEREAHQGSETENPQQVASQASKDDASQSQSPGESETLQTAEGEKAGRKLSDSEANSVANDPAKQSTGKTEASTRLSRADQDSDPTDPAAQSATAAAAAGAAGHSAPGDKGIPETQKAQDTQDTERPLAQGIPQDNLPPTDQKIGHETEQASESLLENGKNKALLSHIAEEGTEKAEKAEKARKAETEPVRQKKHTTRAARLSEHLPAQNHQSENPGELQLQEEGGTSDTRNSELLTGQTAFSEGGEEGQQDSLSSALFQNSESASATKSNTAELQVFLVPDSPAASDASGAPGRAPRMSTAEFMEQFKSEFRQQLSSDIVRQARYIFKGYNSGEISLVLKPEKFGRVRIRMQMEDKSIGGKIFVENKHVQEAFTELLEDLRQAFAEQGFENLNLEIDLDNGAEPDLQLVESREGRNQPSIDRQIEAAQIYIREFESVNILV